MNAAGVKVSFNSDGTVEFFRYTRDEHGQAQTAVLNSAGTWIRLAEFAIIPEWCRLDVAELCKSATEVLTKFEVSVA